MAVTFDTDMALQLYKQKGGDTTFEPSLKQVLDFIQHDNNFNDIREVAWFLGTAKVESDYSLQRWEADYVCGKRGLHYGSAPCKKALDYYRSTKNKKNYYSLGTDKKGLPYFGRGLIQLTGKSNYEKFGKLLGIDLVNNGDLAMTPENSYKIASAYFNTKKRGYGNRSVNDIVLEGDFPTARKVVKGSTKTWEKAKGYYDIWMEVLQALPVEVKKKAKVSPIESEADKKKSVNKLVIAGIGMMGIGIAVIVYLKLIRK